MVNLSPIDKYGQPAFVVIPKEKPIEKNAPVLIYQKLSAKRFSNEDDAQ